LEKKEKALNQLIAISDAMIAVSFIFMPFRKIGVLINNLIVLLILFSFFTLMNHHLNDGG